MKQIGIYVHFPFCKKKCLYCDFPSFAGMEKLMKHYMDALRTELKSWERSLSGIKIKTIFFGGGTPTLFDVWELVSLLDLCFDTFDVEPEAELTIEANPGTLSKDMLKILRRNGFNRLSMGVQSMNNGLLKLLGRLHSRETVVSNLYMAREAGFENINMDIMFGLPNQNMDEWLDTLEQIINMELEHISAYSLKIEENTEFYRMMSENRLQLPSEEEEREMYYLAREYLNKNGFYHYEISNFCSDGKACRHNLIYWNNEEYLGFGSSAHSFFNKQRFYNMNHPAQYIKKIGSGQSAVEYRETIDKRQEIFETVMLGLRLVEGINKKKFAMRFGADIHNYYHIAIDRLKNQGLLVEDQNSIRLTLRGMDIQNTVLLAFMD